MVCAVPAITVAVLALNSAFSAAFPMEQAPLTMDAEASTIANTASSGCQSYPTSTSSQPSSTIPTVTITALPTATPCGSTEEPSLQLIFSLNDNGNGWHSCSRGHISQNPAQQRVALGDISAFLTATPMPTNAPYLNVAPYTTAAATSDTQPATTAGSISASVAATSTACSGLPTRTATILASPTVISSPTVSAGPTSVPVTPTHTGVNGKPTATVFIPNPTTFCYRHPERTKEPAISATQIPVSSPSQFERRSMQIDETPFTNSSLISAQPSRTTDAVDPRLVARMFGMHHS